MSIPGRSLTAEGPGATLSLRWTSRDLAQRGAKLFVRAYGCQRRQIPLSDPDRFNYCGLVVLTDLVNGCERFLALN